MKKKRTKILLFLLIVCFLTPIFMPMIPVHATGSTDNEVEDGMEDKFGGSSPWLKDSDESIYENPIDAKEEPSQTKPKPPGMVEKSIAEFFRNVASSLLDLLQESLHASLDTIIYGRVGSGQPNKVNIYAFELRKGNPYGVTGSVCYSLIRGMCYIFIGVTFVFLLAKSAWSGQTSKSRDEIKSSLTSMVYKFAALSLMPFFLDVALYVRDVILYGIKNVTSQMITGGATLNISDVFLNRAEATGTFVDAVMYLGTVVLTGYFVYIYVSVAIDMMICFVAYPGVSMFPQKKQELGNKLLMGLLGDLITPIIDAVLLLIPLLTSLMLSNVIKGVAIIQLLMCMLIIPARSRIKGLLGVQNYGERNGIMGMMGAMALGRLIGNKVKSGIEKVSDIAKDTKSSSMHGDLANVDKEEQDSLISSYSESQSLNKEEELSDLINPNSQEENQEQESQELSGLMQDSGTSNDEMGQDTGSIMEGEEFDPTHDGIDEEITGMEGGMPNGDISAMDTEILGGDTNDVGLGMASRDSKDLDTEMPCGDRNDIGSGMPSGDRSDIGPGMPCGDSNAIDTEMPDGVMKRMDAGIEGDQIPSNQLDSKEVTSTLSGMDSQMQVTDAVDSGRLDTEIGGAAITKSSKSLTGEKQVGDEADLFFGNSKGEKTDVNNTSKHTPPSLVASAKPQTTADVINGLEEQIQDQVQTVGALKQQKAGLQLQSRQIGREMLNHQSYSDEHQELQKRQADIGIQIAQIDQNVETANGHMTSLKGQLDTAKQINGKGAPQTEFDKRREDILRKQATINNFETPEFKGVLSHTDLQRLYKQRATSNGIKAIGKLGAATAAGVTLGSMGVFVPTAGAAMASAGINAGSYAAEKGVDIVTSVGNTLSNQTANQTANQTYAKTEDHSTHSTAASETQNKTTNTAKGEPYPSENRVGNVPERGQEEGEHQVQINRQAPIKENQQMSILSHQIQSELRSAFMENGAVANSLTLKAIQKANIQAEKYFASQKEKNHALTPSEMQEKRNELQTEALTEELIGKMKLEDAPDSKEYDKVKGIIREKVKKIISKKNKSIF